MLPGPAPVDDGGVERHHLVERVGELRRGVLEMFVEAFVSGLPGGRVTSYELVAEVGADQRVGVEDGAVLFGQEAAVAEV